jgi:rubrerythrin
MAWFGFGKKSFDELSEPEILALAISSEEDDGAIYAAYADHLRAAFPASASVFDEMAAEETEHRRRLVELFRARFGERIPLIRREHVRGFYERRPTWLVKSLSLDVIRREAILMEAQAHRFYRTAAARTGDARMRQLLLDLAEAEKSHTSLAHRLGQTKIDAGAHAEEAEAARRMFVLQYVQPGLVGLMDGSVSTLAPVFAAAIATQNTWETFLIGTAAAIGAGISMGFAEALSDDGKLSGRGSPWIRGLSAGVMTTIGGLGHSLPFLIPNFQVAMMVAIAIVVIELWAISWIRWKYMDTPFWRAAFQVVVGGVLVFLTGVFIGAG